MYNLPTYKLMVVLELTDNVLKLQDHYTRVSTAQMNSIRIKYTVYPFLH